MEFIGADNQLEVWHRRMGHTSERVMVKTQLVTYGMPALRRDIKTTSSGCMKGKQTVSTFPLQSTSKTSRVLELVHTDLMGSIQTVSNGEARYVLTFVSAFLRFVVAYFLRKKIKVAAKLAKYNIFFEKQWG